MNHVPVIRASVPHRSGQSGVALIVGLIILMVLTIIGVTAIKISTQQERMAASYQQQAQSFQEAESAIRLVLAQLNNRPGTNLSLSTGITINTDMLTAVLGAAPATFYGDTTGMPPADPDGTANAVMQLVSGNASAGGSGFNSRANFYATNPGSIPPMTGASFGKFSAFAFDINAVATQPSTMARTQSIQGIWYIAPKQGL